MLLDGDHPRSWGDLWIVAGHIGLHSPAVSLSLYLPNCRSRYFAAVIIFSCKFYYWYIAFILSVAFVFQLQEVFVSKGKLHTGKSLDEMLVPRELCTVMFSVTLY